MESLLQKIEELKGGEIAETISERMQSFKEIGSGEESIFKELCFCICTANNSAERGLRAQEEIDFCGLEENKLRDKMREIVCRFYNNKTDYVLLARRKRGPLLEMLSRTEDSKTARDWIVRNIKGIGLKEASHFLRNIGYDDVAIIDFHIIDILVDYELIMRPKSLTPTTYRQIESTLESLARKAGISLAEIDLYLWYLETGKILK
jgi:N-glycosylase/DNA lyase